MSRIVHVAVFVVSFALAGCSTAIYKIGKSPTCPQTRAVAIADYGQPVAFGPLSASDPLQSLAWRPDYRGTDWRKGGFTKFEIYQYRGLMKDYQSAEASGIHSVLTLGLREIVSTPVALADRVASTGDLHLFFAGYTSDDSDRIALFREVSERNVRHLKRATSE